MAARALDRAPRIVPLYARAAAAALVPGAGRLPFLPGGDGGEIPTALELELPGVEADPAHLAAYARVCGFRLRDELPATYLHVVAFPLHLALMADGRFPFGAVGLVHVANTITHVRPVRLGERIAMHVRPTALEAHPRGRVFTIVSQASVGGDVVWREESTFLRREGGGGAPRDTPAEPAEPPPARAEWRLPGDLGRRYAAVSGDRNPIHMHDLGAKLFGFPRTIAHGMWTQARCLAALERGLPGAYTVTVRFRRPVLLPSRVTFGRADAAGGATRFAVHATKDRMPHLEGRVTPG